MAKQLNVNLAFTADTTLARNLLQLLQLQLNTAMASANLTPGLGLTKDIAEASQAAALLKTLLQSATNVNTGKLDLGKFSLLLKLSNMSLLKYLAALIQLGPAGQQAFSSLAQSIANAEMPLFRVSEKIRSLGTVIKNTAKWQISSTMLHAITGAILSAFSYAKNLNESLNNIRIVTGQSAELMDAFAERANKAAKALSTSTLNYTKASLIYYQLGLSDKEVEDRTNVTIKMANVSRLSAEEVSDQMTAIWNNFDDGSKSLEHYGDVLTKLGAETASSSSEIAEGMEKFAAISKTVGLSYENAAAALATVTAKTRQSADVVGTAFKTLFSRMEQLKFGETLDDGTTLGQYSLALQKVGVDIKDANGELKDMDLIIEETGNKWSSLSRDQLVALAQLVAGIRLYQQFIALMDNYDFYKENLERAKNSDGTLQAQADIYAESWEAVGKRVKASFEKLYTSLLEDDFFINILNGIETVIDFVNKLIKSMGGIPGILAAISTLVFKIASPAITNGLNNLALSLNQIFRPGKVAEQTQNFKAEALQLAETMSMDTQFGAEGLARLASYEKLLSLLTTYIENAKFMNEQERQLALLMMDSTKAGYEKLILLGKSIDKKLEEIRLAKEDLLLNSQGLGKNLANFSNTVEAAAYGDYNAQKLNTMFDSASSVTVEDTLNTAQNLKSNIELVLGADKIPQFLDTLIVELEKFSQLATENMTEPLLKFLSLLEVTTTDAQGKVKVVANEFSMRNNVARATGEATLGTNFNIRHRMNTEVNKEELGLINNGNFNSSEIRKVRLNITSVTKETAEFADKNKAAGKTADEEKEKFKEMGLLADTLSQKIVKTAGAISLLSMGLTSILGAINTLKDGTFDLTTLFSLITSLSMGFSMTLSGLNSLLGVNTVLTALSRKEITATTLAATANIGVKTAELILERREKGEKLGLIGLLAKEKINIVAANIARALGIPLKNKEAITNRTLAASEYTVLGPLLLIIAAMAALAIGIAVVVTVVKQLTAAYNADKIAMEDAKKHADAMAEAYTNVKLAYEDLKKSLEDYNKAENAIDVLKKGTNEWKQAILEANEQVLELLDKYPELSKYVENIDGRLVISEENLQKALEELSLATVAAALIKQSSQLEYRKAASEYNETELIRNELDTADFGEAVGKFLLHGGNLFGIGAAIVNNAAEGAASRAALEGLTEAYKENSTAVDLAFASASTAEELRNKLTEHIGDVGEELSEALFENKDAVLKQIQTEKQLSEDEIKARLNEVDTLLYNQRIFNSNRYGTGVLKMALETYNSIYDLIDDKEIEDYRTNGLFHDWSKEAGKEAVIRYLLSVYLKSEPEAREIYDRSDFGEDKIKFDDEDNIEDITYEQLKAADTRIKIAEKATEIAEKVNGYTNRISNLSTQFTDNAAENILSSFMENGSLDYLDPTIYAKFVEEGLSIVDIENAITEADWKNAGYKSAQEMLDAILEEYRNFNPELALANLLSKIKENIKATFDAASLELEINTSAFEMYADELYQANGALIENAETIANLTVAHYRLAKGVKELKKVFLDNIEVLRTSTDDSLDYYEALGKVKELVEKTFGLKVSANFIKENLETILSMANGSEEALKSLRQSLVKDFVMNLTLDDSKKLAILNGIQELQNELQDKDLTTKISLDNSDAINAINTALATGKVTIEELQTLFLNADLAMPQYKMTSIPHTSVSEATTTVSGNGMFDGTYTTTTETTTFTQVPYFGENEPKYELNKKTGQVELSHYKDSNGNNVGMDPGTSGTGFSKLNSNNSLKSILNYDGKNINSETSKKNLEIDTLHYYKKNLDSISEALEKISKAKDKAFGKTKLLLIQLEIDKLKELIEALKKYNEEAEKALSTAAGYAKGAGALFDENGNIINYVALQKKANSLSAHGDSTGAENITKAISNYESAKLTFDLSIEDLQDKIYELAELELEKIDYAIEFDVELDDRGLKLLDYYLDRLEDKPFKAAEAIALLSQQTEVNLSKMDSYKNGINEVLKAVGATDELVKQFVEDGNADALNGLTITSDLLEKLYDYSDLLLEMNLTLAELGETIKEKLLSVLEDANDEFEKISDNLERLKKITSSYKDIIGVLGKEMLGINAEFLRELDLMVVETSANQVKVAKTALDLAKLQLADARAQLAAATTEDTREYWQDVVDLITDDVNEKEQTFLDSWSEALEAAADAFKSSVESITNSFSESISPIYKNLEAMLEMLDLNKDLNELYLEDYKKAYETSKLIRSIGKSINNTDNLKAQREYNELAQEVAAYQADGKKMSDYDLQYLQKRYDLLQAQYALEDARNAKTTIRLLRDSMGNYGYVYAANLDSIADAEQKVEDAQYALDNLNAEAIKNNSEKIIGILKDYNDAIAELDAENILDREEYERRLLELRDYYLQLLQANFDLINAATINSGLVYSDTLLGLMLPSYSSFEEASAGITQLIEDMNIELMNNYDIFGNNVDNIMVEAGTSVETFRDDVKVAMDEIRAENNETGDNTKKLKDTIITAFGEALKGVSNWEKEYAGVLEKARGANELLYSSIGKLASNYSTLEGNAKSAATAIWEAARALLYANGLNSSIGNKTPPVTPPKYEQALGEKHADERDNSIDNSTKLKLIATASNNIDYYITGKGENSLATKRQETINGVEYYVLDEPIDKNNPGLYVKKTDFVKRPMGDLAYIPIGKPIYGKQFAKGGYVNYTGPAWVDGTPSAPEAFLSAELTRIIGDFAAALQGNINIASRGLNLSSVGLIPNVEDRQIQLNISITAEFPNAVNHNEIEEAFNTLVNRAALYVDRDNK